MSDGTRWVVIVVVALVVVGMIAFARGPEHHRGADVGSRASVPPSVVVIAP
jgi:hypothetical protein